MSTSSVPWPCSGVTPFLCACTACALSLPQIEDAVDSLCDSAFAGLDAGPAQVECDKLPKMPSVRLTIGGRVYTLRPEQYVLKVCAGSSHSGVRLLLCYALRGRFRNATVTVAYSYYC